MDSPLGPRKSPRQRRSRQTVDWILIAATQLFTTDGYRETTTNKIAERAGVSIGTLYQYFPNKDALLVALAERHMTETGGQVVAAIERAADEHCSLSELLRSVVAAAAEPHTDESALHRLLFQHALRSPATLSALRTVERRIADALAEQLVRLGVGGPDPGLSALLVVQGVEAHLHGAALEPPDGRSAEQVVDAVVELWTAALNNLPAPLDNRPQKTRGCPDGRSLT